MRWRALDNSSLETSSTNNKSQSFKFMSNVLFDVKWKIDKTKSRFTTESWNPDSEERVYEEVSGGYKLTVTGVKQDKAYSWGYTALYDGKPHPVYGRPNVDTIIAYKVTDLITIGFFEKNGETAARYMRYPERNGNTLEVVDGGINVDGSPYFDVIIYLAQRE